MPPLSSLPGNTTPEARRYVEVQTDTALAQVQAVETGFRIKVRKDTARTGNDAERAGNGSPFRGGDDYSAREAEATPPLGSNSDRGIAGLMRGWKSMTFSGT